MARKRRVLGIISREKRVFKLLDKLFNSGVYTHAVFLVGNPLIKELDSTLVTVTALGPKAPSDMYGIDAFVKTTDAESAVKTLIDQADKVVLYGLDREKYSKIYEYAAGKHFLDFQDLSDLDSEDGIPW